MALTAGTRLGPYEILFQIGKGGMGEVYKAKDTRLDRTVAIKVLPSHLSDNARLKERFEREARAVSSLNHPHICTLYDIGSENGVDFMVMEHIEGETLADRLQKGALPLDQALQHGIQIADALDKAHRQGVVHRDLKPANVMLAEPGVKLLDFGLAKLMPEPSKVEPEMATVTKMTREGAIVGTLQYMAPEQVEGKKADARTDIFAFGAVMYEMVTGRKAFEGKSRAGLIAAILERDPPPLSELQPISPPALERVVKKCLAKDPDERWQTAQALLDLLKWIAEGGAQADQASRTLAVPGPRQRLATGVAGALVAALLAGLVVWSLTAPPSRRPVTRSAMVLPPSQQLWLSAGRHVVALSPDGTKLVYVANQQLYLRAMDQMEATPIRGTENGSQSPFFSLDGQWVGFWAEGKLKKVSIGGGAPVSLSDARSPFGASWAPDDTIVFGQRFGGILRVSADGGAPEVLIPVDAAKGERAHGPQILPGGKAVLFTLAVGTDWDEAQIVVQSLDTGERSVLVEGGSDARYVPTEHLVYALAGTLLAVPFDLARLEATGGPVPLVEGVMRSHNTGAAHFSLSQNGSLVYIAGPLGGGAKRRLVWVDRQGREEVLTAEPRAYTQPRISPDGNRLALGVDDQDRDIWIWDFARETLTRFTFHTQFDTRPLWTPDGQRIVFESHREGQGNVFAKPARGTGPVERLTESPSHQRPISTSPDGAWVVFEDGLSRINLTLLPFASEGEPQPLLHSEFNEMNGEISPDVRWLAYESDESGQFEIYVRPFPNVDEGLFQISRGGGVQPLWAPSGRELFYGSLEGSLMAVPVQSGGNLLVGNPEIIIEQPYVGGQRDPREYDISPDGKRFLMIKETDDSTSPRELILVQNWFEELKRLVPTN